MILNQVGQKETRKKTKINIERAGKELKCVV